MFKLNTLLLQNILSVAVPGIAKYVVPIKIAMKKPLVHFVSG